MFCAYKQDVQVWGVGMQGLSLEYRSLISYEARLAGGLIV